MEEGLCGHAQPPECFEAPFATYFPSSKLFSPTTQSCMSLWELLADAGIGSGKDTVGMVLWDVKENQGYGTWGQRQDRSTQHFVSIASL